MTGRRTALVTGANSGIGAALVEQLAAGGHDVILAARSAERTRPVVDGIRARHPEIRATFLALDLADLGAIRRAVATLAAAGTPVDLLVNNAGVAGTRALSADGFDLTYATNHLGPFLLTDLLLPVLRTSAAGRIVNVASVAHARVRRLSWEGLEPRVVPRPSRFTDYAVTKLMNVLHAAALARRLAGSRVTVAAMHPGGVASNIWRKVPQPFRWLITRPMISNADGAASVLHVATAPELQAVSGRYYHRYRERTPSALATDVSLAEELWTRTASAIARTGR